MSGECGNAIQHEVHFQEPRHPCENPLLLVCCEKYPEEWYFEVRTVGDRVFAVADCRIDFRPDGGEPKNLGDATFIPEDIEQAVLEYDGTYSADMVPNPTKERDEYEP